MTVKTVSVRRKSKDFKFGIIFCRKYAQSPLTIKKVHSDGAFHSKGLLPGMVVSKINGRTVQWETPADAAVLLNSKQPGTDVTVTVEIFSAKVRRKSTKDPWGLFIKKSRSHSNTVVVWRLEGMFSETEIEPGMTIIQINGKACPKNAKDAYDLIKQSHKHLEIVAVDMDHVDVDQYWEDKKKEAEMDRLAIPLPGYTACVFDDHISSITSMFKIFGGFGSSNGNLSEGNTGDNPRLTSLRQMTSISAIHESALATEFISTQEGAKKTSKSRVMMTDIGSFFQTIRNKEMDASVADTDITSLESKEADYKQSIGKKKLPTLKKLLPFTRPKKRKDITSFFQMVKTK